MEHRDRATQVVGPPTRVQMYSLNSEPESEAQTNVTVSGQCLGQFLRLPLNLSASLALRDWQCVSPRLQLALSLSKTLLNLKAWRLMILVRAAARWVRHWPRQITARVTVVIIMMA